MAYFESETQVQPSLEFDDWADLYAQLGSTDSPAELHGILVGGLCTGQRLTPAEWMRIVTEHVGMAVHEEGNQEARAQFEALYREWERFCKGDLLVFAPLLPDDVLPLTQRLEAIGAWCTGFIEGFSRGAAVSRPDISAETGEILTDLMAIAEIDPEAEESDEQELYYAELVEFVRVAVMSLLEEFNHSSSPPPGSSLH